jgi:hypothetical protein
VHLVSSIITQKGPSQAKLVVGNSGIEQCISTQNRALDVVQDANFLLQYKRHCGFVTYCPVIIHHVIV